MTGASRLLVSVALAATFALAACATRTPPAVPESRTPALRLAPQGSEYFFDRWTGPGFNAKLHLARQAPLASGVSTVSVGVSIVRDALTAHGRLSGATPDEVVLTAHTPTGTVEMGGIPAGPGGGLRDGLSAEELERAFPVPPRADSIRLTIHLGRTPAEAAEGASVEVPLTAIPVVENATDFFFTSPME